MILESQTIAALAKALSAFQGEAEAAKKNAKNPHLGNKYADLASVIEAVREPLAKHGLSFVQRPIPSDDNRLHLETRLLHESGEFIASVIVMPLTKQDPQGYGSALSYARRYALTAMLGVAQEDDDGEAATRPQANTTTRQQSNQRQAPQRQEQEEDPPPPPPVAKMATKAQVDAIGSLVAKLGWEAAKSTTFLREKFGKSTRVELTNAEATKAIDLLSKMKPEADDPSADEIANQASAALNA